MLLTHSCSLTTEAKFWQMLLTNRYWFNQSPDTRMLFYTYWGLLPLPKSWLSSWEWYQIFSSPNWAVLIFIISRGSLSYSIWFCLKSNRGQFPKVLSFQRCGVVASIRVAGTGCLGISILSKSSTEDNLCICSSNWCNLNTGKKQDLTS